jgi:hypothetical protein
VDGSGARCVTDTGNNGGTVEKAEPGDGFREIADQA